MDYRRMPIEIEAPEGLGYDTIDCNLSESSFTDQRLGDLGISLDDLLLVYGNHLGKAELRQLIAAESNCSPEDVLITAGAAAALFDDRFMRIGYSWDKTEKLKKGLSNIIKTISELSHSAV